MSDHRLQVVPEAVPKIEKAQLQVRFSDQSIQTYDCDPGDDQWIDVEFGQVPDITPVLPIGNLTPRLRKYRVIMTAKSMTLTRHDG